MSGILWGMTADDKVEKKASGGRWPRTVSEALTITRRNLPHWQAGGSTYFITFHLRHPGESRGWRRLSSTGPLTCAGAPYPAPLGPEDRALVKAEILFWRHVRWRVHALTVMPTHVHVLATPLEESPGQWFSLSTIMHSLKMGATRRVNQRRRTRGSRGRTRARTGSSGMSGSSSRSGPISTRTRCGRAH